MDGEANEGTDRGDAEVNLVTIHLPEHGEKLRGLWSLLCHSYIDSYQGRLWINDDNPVPTLRLDHEGIHIIWDGLAVTLRRTGRTKILFDLYSHESVALGKGFSIRFPDSMVPYAEDLDEAVALRWKEPPVISSTLLPDIAIRKVILNKYDAVIVTRLFNIKVTW